MTERVVEIDWEKSPEVVLPEVEAIAVYRQGNTVVIRQKEGVGDNEHIIHVPAKFAEILVKAITAAAGVGVAKTDR